MNLPDWVPAVNLGLGLVGFGMLLYRTTARQSEYPNEIRELFRLTLALFFGLLLVSAAMLGVWETPDSVVAGITVVKVYALVVVWRSRNTKYRTGTRTADGNPGADQNRDVD